MKVFSICGVSRSGKTTTAEAIIKELTSRGRRVGSIKEIHYERFEIDPDPASNTRRHRQAGAGLVTARGLFETDLLFPGKLPIEKILSFYEGECDWVVMEGVADSAAPVVVTAHSETDLVEKWSEAAMCVSGRIATEIYASGRVEAETQGYRSAPVFDATVDAALLVDFLEKNVPEWNI